MVAGFLLARLGEVGLYFTPHKIFFSFERRVKGYFPGSGKCVLFF